MHSNIKAKLGSPAFAFADAPQADPLSFKQLFHAKRWLPHSLAAALAVVVASAVVANQNVPINVSVNTSEHTAAPANIDVVKAKGDGDKLVGTLIHNHPESSGLSDMSTNPNKAITLTPQERTRLLQIINK